LPPGDAGRDLAGWTAVDGPGSPVDIGVVKRALDVLVVAAYLTVVVAALGSDGSVVTLLPGTAFAVLATAGFGWLHRRDGRALAAGYVAVQIGLGYATFVLSGAAAGAVLLMVALVCQSVLLLPLHWVAVVVAVQPLMHLGMAWEDGLREGLGSLAAGVFAAVVTQLLVREQRARGALAQAHRQLQEYAVRAERLAATQERNRVARDIHDGLGHALTVVQMQVKAARAVLGIDPAKADAVLAKAQRQAEEALVEIRRSVAALREPLAVPLPDALRELADEMSATGVPTDLEIRGSARGLAAEAEESLFRAAQEGLTNVRKHAQATRVELRLDYSRPAAVRLEVRDDGTGLVAASEAATATGYGLVGVRERAAHLGGLMSVESAPGRGSTLRVEVPG
jgi:signal transduction histidine kinase